LNLDKVDYVVVDKYNSFCNILPDKKVADYRPYKRFLCKHLENSITVHMDGTVSICHQDIRKKYIIGDLKKQNLVDIFNNEFLLELFTKQNNNIFDSNELCKNCDEWYIPLT
jgi:radical SAM protein with 4Fe4S-binding SPASM domain